MSAAQYIIDANPGSVFIFSGDLNLPDLSWSNDDFGLIYSSSGPAIHCVPDVFACNNFFQLNHIPNSNGNFLDLVFSNDFRINIEKFVTGVVPCDPYHPSLVFMLTFVDDLPSIDRCHKYYNFRKACYPRISTFLSSFNWLETLATTDIDSATCALYDALHYCVTSFVPLVVFKPSKFPSWFSKNLKNIVFAKKEMHAKYKALRNPADYNKFSNLRAQYKYYYKKCYKTFLDNTENKLKVNPRLFWVFVRKRRSSNGIPNSVHLNDLTATGPESISSLFSSYFNSVYVPSPASSLPDIPFAQHTLPSDCIFNVDDVENGLAALKNWVKVLGSKSAVVPVPSGVPQGGHLSPLLFSLFINGITKAVPKCRFLMFTDDLKLFRKIKSEADCLALQNELDSISLWFSTLGLQFNTNKCKAMSFTRRRLVFDYSYTINGSELQAIATWAFFSLPI
ncbi:hypothetical protein QTP88_000756 [Uroleucon formosanum]